MIFDMILEWSKITLKEKKIYAVDIDDIYFGKIFII